ncbi:MAG: hypothetical protein DRP02_02400 [Candidatus Gerdarchaeota archaeon]|nr:MAG: hypothetical protein DRP02_02400 [Candidatus Gerdarchaeota archaeon]
MADINFGTEEVFNSGTTAHTDVAKLDDTHFVASYRDTSGGGNGEVVIGVYDGDEITSYGTPVSFGVDVDITSIKRINDSTFVLAYKESSPQSGKVVIGTVSGTSITLHTTAQFNGGSTPDIEVDVLDSTHFVIGYKSFSASNAIIAVVCSLSGTTITVGTPNTASGINSGNARVTALDSTHFALLYSDGQNSNYGTVIIGSVSGTTISYGTASAFNSSATSQVAIATLNSTHFVVVFSDGTGKAIVGETDGGTTIDSYGSESAFASENAIQNGLAALDSGTFVVAFRGLTDGTGTAVVGSVTGTTIDGYGTENDYATPSYGAYNAVGMLSATAFVISYADNNNSSYGTAIIGELPPTTPIMSTEAATSLTNEGATLNGTIVDVGEANPTVRGFYYKEGSTGDPTASDMVISSNGDFSAGAFTEELTGLDFGTDYRIAAFATNSAGTDVGETVGMTTLIETPTVTTQNPSDVVQETATLNGNITDVGDENATERGFYYKQGTTGDPTSADTVVSDLGDFGAGAYTKGISGLTAGTAYRVAAFATNGGGTVVGSTVNLLTLDVPSMTTEAVSDIEPETATLNGTITDTGNDNPTERGFYYKEGSSGDPTASDSKISSFGDFGVGAYTESLSGLPDSTDFRVAAFSTNSIGTTIGATVGFSTIAYKKIVAGTVGAMQAVLDELDPDTTYYVRAFATNSEGTAYGDDVEFKTHKLFIPSVISGN